MALPTVNTALFPITLPLSGEQVTIRQMMSGEYKALLNAVTRNDDKVISETISSVIQSCIRNDVKLDNLAYADVEFIFLKLYALGIDNAIPLRATCSECGTSFNFSIPIDEIQSVGSSEPKTIKHDNIIISLKYPTWKVWKTIAGEGEDSIIFAIVDSIFDEETAYIPGTDFTKEELLEFIDKLPVSVVDQIVEFIENLPTIEWKREIACPSCGKKYSLHYKGLRDFLM